MTREPDEPDGQREPTAADVEAAFAEIVAAWEQELSQVPADEAAEAAEPAGQHPQASRPPDEPEQPDPPPALPAGKALDEDDDHFVPPEPPPLPWPQPATVGALLLVALGVVLLASPNLIGFSEQYGLPLGLLSITGAIAWLVARLREGPPTDSGWDDGAQL